MEVAITTIAAVATLSTVVGFVFLILCINFGIFPRPDEDQIARHLYWRRQKTASGVQANLVGSDNYLGTFSTDVGSIATNLLFQTEIFPTQQFADKSHPNTASIRNTAGGENMATAA
jgi:hypothetical protein